MTVGKKLRFFYQVAECVANVERRAIMVHSSDGYAYYIITLFWLVNNVCRLLPPDGRSAAPPSWRNPNKRHVSILGVLLNIYNETTTTHNN